MAKNRAKKKSEKLFDDQLDGENVLYVFRKHPVVMRKGLILGMLSILFGTFPSLIKPEYSYFFGGLAAGLVLGILLYLPAWIAWYFSVYIVTDQRLIQVKHRGLFHRSVVDLDLNQIQSLNYEVSGFEATILGYGTILVQTYMGELFIEDVHHPAKIYKKLLTILRDHDITPTQMASEGTEANNS